MADYVQTGPTAQVEDTSKGKSSDTQDVCSLQLPPDEYEYFRFCNHKGRKSRALISIPTASPAQKVAG
jgi:hypothetical protein